MILLSMTCINCLFIYRRPVLGMLTIRVRGIVVNCI